MKKFFRAKPHNSKCRYGERGAAAAKPKAQIILDVLSSILATQMPCRTPSRSEALRSATAACGGSWRGDPPERCLSRQAGIVRYCLRYQLRYCCVGAGLCSARGRLPREQLSGKVPVPQGWRAEQSPAPTVRYHYSAIYLLPGCACAPPISSSSVQAASTRPAGRRVAAHRASMLCGVGFKAA